MYSKIIEIILMCVGVVCIGVLITPHDLPAIWSSLRSWVRPPYLYIIINAIIISIAASSRLHLHHTTHAEEEFLTTPPPQASPDVLLYTDDYHYLPAADDDSAVLPPPPLQIHEEGTSSPQGPKALQEANETLDNTWKRITEAQKSDTWQNRGRLLASSKPSSTLKERRSNFSRTRRLKKERSVSQDELNRRVEAFINKFKQEMRLQSIQQYVVGHD